MVNKNDVIKGEMTGSAHEGHSVIKLDRCPISIPSMLIDEEVEFKAIEVKKNFAIGKLIKVLKQSE